MPTKANTLQITVAHAIPNRLRLRLSHPPQKFDRIEKVVMSHAGVHSATYTDLTFSLLIQYDSRQVALEEIILRAALFLSTDYYLNPVVIKTAGVKTPLSALSVISGLSLLAAHTLSFLSKKTSSLYFLNLICGLGTTAAVSEHIYLDLKNKGRFHPEVLSIGYLLSSFIRGNIIKGATTAWVMTFARHLLEPQSKAVKVEANAIDPSCDEHQCEYEATISRETAGDNGTMSLFSQLPNLLLGMYTDRQLTAEDKIFKNIQTLSSVHDDVLEGLEHLKRGIRLRVGI